MATRQIVDISGRRTREVVLSIAEEQAIRDAQALVVTQRVRSSKALEDLLVSKGLVTRGEIDGLPGLAVAPQSMAMRMVNSVTSFFTGN